MLRRPFFFADVVNWRVRNSYRWTFCSDCGCLSP